MHEITPESILAHRFASARWKGYDTIEVDGYLENLAGYVGELRYQLATCQSREKGAFDLLQNAQRVADATLVAAAASAEQNVAESRRQAYEIVSAAEAQAAAVRAQSDAVARDAQRSSEELNRFVNEAAADLRLGASRLNDAADHFQFAMTARNEVLGVGDGTTTSL